MTTAGRYLLRPFTLGLALVPLLACQTEEGATQNPTGEQQVLADEDPVVMDATEATRANHGVVAWGMRQEQSATVIRGYDDAGSPIVTFEHRMVMLGDHHLGIAMTVTERDQQTATMKIDVEGKSIEGEQQEIHFTILENTFYENDGAVRVLDTIVADADAHPPRQVTRSSSLTSSITPKSETELTDGLCVDLTFKCGFTIAKTAKNLLGLGSCVKVAKGIVLIGRCTGTGASFGPWGAALGLAICAGIEAPTLAKDGPKCVKSIIGTAKNGSEIKNDCTKKCEASETPCSDKAECPTNDEGASQRCFDSYRLDTAHHKSIAEAGEACGCTVTKCPTQ